MVWRLIRSPSPIKLLLQTDLPPLFWSVFQLRFHLIFKLFRCHEIYRRVFPLSVIITFDILKYRWFSFFNSFVFFIVTKLNFQCSKKTLRRSIFVYISGATNLCIRLLIMSVILCNFKILAILILKYLEAFEVVPAPNSCSKAWLNM